MTERRRAPAGAHVAVRGRVRLYATVAMVLAGACAGATVPTNTGAQPVPRVRAGVTITPDTVTVGDPFVVQVRIAAPPGAVVTFPAGPDSAGAVALLDPMRETAATAADGSVDVTAIYRAAAWDVGAVPLGLGEVVVRSDGAERRVPLGALRVSVRSVLPADSTQRDPKPVREPVPDPGLWWLPLAIAAALALAAITLLVWLARRWWHRRRTAVPADAAYREAMAAFARLDALRLVEAGEGGRHVALAADIARDYLAARRPAADRAHTTGELLAALRDDADVPVERLAALLGRADLVKFAGVGVAAGGAAEGGREARAVVDTTEEAVRAREVREAEEAAARERAAREARRRYEEERRRASRAEGAANAGPDAGASTDDPRDGQERAA